MANISVWFIVLVLALLVADFRYAILNLLAHIDVFGLFALLLVVWYFR